MLEYRKCVTCKECNVARMNNFTYDEMKIIGLSIKKIKENRLLNI